MRRFKVTGFGRPVKLLVGGLHGNEGKITGKVLEKMSYVKVEKGKVVLCNLCEKSRYVSTLNPAYSARAFNAVFQSKKVPFITCDVLSWTQESSWA